MWGTPWGERWAMSMMFPGMDPYLEHPQVWPDVHASFIVYLREHLRPLLGPRYIVAIATRIFVEGPATDHPIIPDAWVRPNSPETLSETVGVLEADPAVEVQVLPLEVEETYLTIRDRQSGQREVLVSARADDDAVWTRLAHVRGAK
jgi:hypothetical protein